jgi:hypothetical protein
MTVENRDYQHLLGLCVIIALIVHVEFKVLVTPQAEFCEPPERLATSLPWTFL